MQTGSLVQAWQEAAKSCDLDHHGLGLLLVPWVIGRIVLPRPHSTLKDMPQPKTLSGRTANETASLQGLLILDIIQPGWRRFLGVGFSGKRGRSSRPQRGRDPEAAKWSEGEGSLGAGAIRGKGSILKRFHPR